MRITCYLSSLVIILWISPLAFSYRLPRLQHIRLSLSRPPAAVSIVAEVKKARQPTFPSLQPSTALWNTANTLTIARMISVPAFMVCRCIVSDYSESYCHNVSTLFRLRGPWDGLNGALFYTSYLV